MSKLEVQDVNSMKIASEFCRNKILIRNWLDTVDTFWQSSSGSAATKVLRDVIGKSFHSSTKVDVCSDYCVFMIC